MDRNRSFSTLVLGLFATGLMFMAVACNSGTEEPAAEPRAAAVTTPMDGSDSSGAATPSHSQPSDIDPSRFPTELGENVTAGIPDNFPKDVPIYPGSAPAQGIGGASQAGVELSGLQLLTADTPEKAYGYYEGELESGGWDITKSEQNESGGVISAGKDGRRVSILFSPASDGGADIFVISETGEL